MKWRVVVELAGADGSVQSHEISVGGCGTINHSADTLGLTLAEAKKTLAGLKDDYPSASADTLSDAKDLAGEDDPTDLADLNDMKARAKSLVGKAKKEQSAADAKAKAKPAVPLSRSATHRSKAKRVGLWLRLYSKPLCSPGLVWA